MAHDSCDPLTYVTTNSRVSGYEGPDKALRLCDNKNSCIPVS